VWTWPKNGVKREKHPVCGSPVGENALLMLEVRGELTLTEITTRYNRGMQQSICEPFQKKTTKKTKKKNTNDRILL